MEQVNSTFKESIAPAQFETVAQLYQYLIN